MAAAGYRTALLVRLNGMTCRKKASKVPDGAGNGGIGQEWELVGSCPEVAARGNLPSQRRLSKGVVYLAYQADGLLTPVFLDATHCLRGHGANGSSQDAWILRVLICSNRQRIFTAMRQLVEKPRFRKAVLSWSIAVVLLALSGSAWLRSVDRVQAAYHTGRLAVLEGEAFDLNLRLCSWPPYLGNIQVTGIVGTGVEILDVVGSDLTRSSLLTRRSRLVVRIGANAEGECTITGVRADLNGVGRLIPVGQIDVSSMGRSAVQNRRSLVGDAKMSMSGPGTLTFVTTMPDGESVIGLEPPISGLQVTIENEPRQGGYVDSKWSFQFQDWMRGSGCYVIYRPIVVSATPGGEQNQRSLGPLLDFEIKISQPR